LSVAIAPQPSAAKERPQGGPKGERSE